MIKRGIIYLLLIAVTIVLMFLYVDPIIEIVLIMECLYFVFGIIWVVIACKQTNISMNIDCPVAEKNQEVSIIFTVENRFSLFITNMQFHISMQNNLGQKRKKIQWDGKVVKKGKNQITRTFCLKDFGNTTVTLEQCTFWDPLYIFRWKKKTCQSQSILVYPEMKLIHVEVGQKTRRFITEADQYSQRESGDDPTEMYQIREYNEKDSIHDIHWKLSAKMNSLLVKERGKPQGCAVFIWISLLQESKQHAMVLKIIEVVTALSFSLLQEECNHIVAWYDGENQRIIRHKILSIENLYEMLNDIYASTLYDKSKQSEANCRLQELLERENYSSVIQMETDGTIKLNENQFCVPLDKDKIVWEKIYFGV